MLACTSAHGAAPGAHSAGQASSIAAEGASRGGAGAGGAAGVSTSVIDDANGEAFNTATGVLNVDYAGYLSKHDIVYDKPNDTRSRDSP